MKRRRRFGKLNWKMMMAVVLTAALVFYLYHIFEAGNILPQTVKNIARNFTVKYSNATNYEGTLIEEIIGSGTSALSGMFAKKEVTVSGKDDNWYDESLNARGKYIENSNENDDYANDVNDESYSDTDGVTFETEDEDDGEGEGQGAEAEVSVSKNIYVSMPEAVGIKYTLEDLSNSNYIISKFYTVPSSTKLLGSDVEISKIMAYDATVKQDNSKPQILIYHTHSMEGYADSVTGDTSTGIVAVGDYLTTILSEQFGYNVIHCAESFDVDESGNADRTNAYKKARLRLEEILSENPSIEVVLDIHRDGVDESLRFVTEINGKQTAKIMFFNGLCRNSAGNPYGSSEYRDENLALSLQMKLLAEEYYPGFTRKNYVNAYHYNMNLMEKSMLIEVGAQTNTLEEAKNAMEPLAVLLNKILN